MSNERLDVSLDFPQTAYQNFGLIAQHVSRLAEIQKILSEQGAQASLKTVTKKISDTIEVPEADIRRILDALGSLSTIFKRVRAEPVQFVDLVIETIERNALPDWKTKYLSTWIDHKDLVADVITNIGNQDAMLTARKTRELIFSYQNIFTDARIVTELRPVFNKEGDKIVHGVVLHSLMLEYSDSKGGNTRLQLGLDAADVVLLKRLCERAEIKSETIKESLKVMPWELTYPRSSSVPETE